MLTYRRVGVAFLNDPIKHSELKNLSTQEWRRAKFGARCWFFLNPWLLEFLNS